MGDQTSIIYDRKCCACTANAPYQCGRCRSVRYCSKECQLRIRPIHNLLCKDFSNFDMQSRPTSQHFRAIFFSENLEWPQVVWIRRCPRHASPSMCKVGAQYRYDHVDFEFLLFTPPVSNRYPTDYPISYNKVLERLLSNVVRVVYWNGWTGGSDPPRNKCLQRIMSAGPNSGRRWDGPVLAYSTIDTIVDAALWDEPESIRHKDITMEEYHHVIDFFNTPGEDGLFNDPESS